VMVHFHQCFNLETYYFHITAMVLLGLPTTHCHGLPSIN